MRTSTHSLSTGLVALTLAASALLAGCGSDGDTDEVGTPQSSISSSVEPSPSAPTDADDGLTLVPGAAGPVKVGMTKAQALATGLLTDVVENGAEGCLPGQLVWKSPYADVLDVQTLANGEIASIGVRRAGPLTADGLGVGSTLADVLAAYPGAKAVAAGYGQTGVLVEDTGTDGWIGFLVDADPAEAKGTDAVTFIELTAGEKPSVMRDGC